MKPEQPMLPEQPKLDVKNLTKYRIKIEAINDPNFQPVEGDFHGIAFVVGEVVNVLQETPDISLDGMVLGNPGVVAPIIANMGTMLEKIVTEGIEG